MQRRTFLKRAAASAGAAIGFPTIVRASALGGDGWLPASERITVGCIGVGGQGRYDMNGFLASRDAQVVAVCDPKKDMCAAARDIVDKHYGRPVCAMYNDFRELVARTDIDAVQIASPDHWHVLHALAAVRSGKDVYVEKPLGLSIVEIQMLRREVHRYGRIFQFGTQQRSMAQFRQACELVLNGRIGKLRTIRASAPSGHAERTGQKTYEAAPVPEGFDYEMWLGPAPWAPYTPKRVVTPHWYHISDYALGYIAGWGIHYADIAQWGCGAEFSGPVEIEGSAVFPPDDALCDTMLSWDVEMMYANGVRLHFTSDGGPNRHGVRFEGTDGWIFVDRQVIEAEPKTILQEKIGPDEIHVVVSTQHQQNLLDCIRTRGRTACPIDVGVRSDTVCHLADIAVRVGRRLRWDPVKEEFVGDADANRMRTRAMRSPWRL